MGKKILHIGNVANNAYQNAKILNKNGYENTVLSYDYYHVMGCPEWDEVDFKTESVDQYYPQWDKLDLHGFRRPDWFVSGPMIACIRYLMAINKGYKTAAYFDKKYLNECQKSIAENKDTNNYRRSIFSFLYRHFYGASEYMIADIHKQVVDDFSKLFPDRKCKFGPMLDSYISTALLLKPILKYYDVIFAYATNPIFMYLAGVNHYIAYEHGTIRDIPYEDSDLGRLMLLAYAKAKAIYVTNLDCYESAEYITKKTKTPIVCGLHGIDINRLIQKLEKPYENIVLKEILTISKHTFFCPARYDYDDGRKAFIKGNDLMINAAGNLLNEESDYKLILIRWGRDIDKIEQIIQKYPGLSDHIIWLQPVNKADLYYIYNHVDAVLDQFYLRAYGAIDFEAMACDQCVLISSKVEERKQTAFFGQVLPYFGCETNEEIMEAMKHVIKGDDVFISIKNKEKEWIKHYHSEEKIKQALIKAIDFARG